MHESYADCLTGTYFAKTKVKKAFRIGLLGHWAGFQDWKCVGSTKQLFW